MSPRTKIENCSVRISYVAKNYGFKTLGSFHKFLKQCNPNAKLYFGISEVRVSKVLKDVEIELS